VYLLGTVPSRYQGTVHGSPGCFVFNLAGITMNGVQEKGCQPRPDSADWLRHSLLHIKLCTLSFGNLLLQLYWQCCLLLIVPARRVSSDLLKLKTEEMVQYSVGSSVGKAEWRSVLCPVDSPSFELGFRQKRSTNVSIYDQVTVPGA
jgi:hypothetical protein